MNRKALFCAVLLLTMSSSSVYADSVTGIKSLNNDKRGLDYKITQEEFSKIAKQVSVSSDTKEVLASNAERDLEGALIVPKVSGESSNENTGLQFKKIVSSVDSQQLAWLINNNIVSRETGIVAGGSNVAVTKVDALYDENNPLEQYSRTDFLMGIYKAAYGVINSRPIVIKMDSWRNAALQHIEEVQLDDGRKTTRVYYDEAKDQKVSGTGGKYNYTTQGKDTASVVNFEEGDYYMYVSPNVPELYLKGFVDKGIINLPSIANLEFQKEYRLLAENVANSGFKAYPRWYSEAAPYMASAGITQSSDLVKYIDKSKALGESYAITSSDKVDISSQDRGYIIGNVAVTKQETSYFAEESLNTIEALKYIESVLRLTEKDMTDTEAKIVTYKYGAGYLNSLEDEDRKTIMFLTAKGVLNFEDPNEYKGLYSTLTKPLAYKLMYRVANKDARLDFSKIQLTDSDNFWIEKGYGQVNLNFKSLDLATYSKYANEDGTYSIEALPGVQTESVVEKPKTAEVTEPKSFLGIKIFKTKSGLAAKSTSDFVVTKVFDNAKKYEYRGINVAAKEMKTAEWVTSVTTNPTSKQTTVVFTVPSSSSYVAINAVDSSLVVGTDFLFKASGISAVTKYQQDGKEITLVPATMFRDSSLGKQIVVLSDKVLKNTQTGNTAILLQDENIAMIGNHVVNSEDLMVTSIGGEKYYNLEIIRYLMSNMYISSLDFTSIYVSNSQAQERLANVAGSVGNYIGKTYISKFLTPEDTESIGDVKSYSFKNYVNISQLSGASNFLIRNFEVLDKNKQKMTYTVLIQLVYRLPDKEANFLNPLYAKSNPDFKGVNNFIYERPKDNELADWWDNNIYLSNAIANVFYGTTGVKYVNSGYLAPSITVFYDSPGVIKEKHLQKFLQDVGAQLPQDWVEKYVGKYNTYNQPVTNGIDADNEGSIHYPEKPLTVGAYPKWVHAMFNNSSTEANNNGFDGTAKNGRSSTELWRYLMESRSFSALSGLTVGGTSKMYRDRNSFYFQTSSGAIFMPIDESSMKFPMKLVIDGKVVGDDTSWTKGKDFVVKPITRTDLQDNSEWLGKNVTDSKGRVYTVLATGGNALILLDSAEVFGKPVNVKRGKYNYFDVAGTITEGNVKSSPFTKAIQTRYNELYLFFTKDAKATKSVTQFDNARSVSGYSSVIPDGKTVVVDYGMASLNKASSKVFKVVGTNTTKAFNDIGTGNVSAYVKLSLDGNYWAINSSGVLVPRRTFPELQVGNIYYAGINQGVMDSILYSSVGTTSVNKLKDGATLLVGDVLFTKAGDKFISQPQTNIKSWSSVIADANSKLKLQSSIFSAMAGMAINSTGKKTINTSYVPLPLIAFVKGKGLAPPTNYTAKNKITLLGGDASTGTPYVYKFKNGELTSSQYSKNNPPGVSGVVFYVKFDDALMARSLSEDGTSYKLLFSTSALAEGHLDSVPFFTEDLNLTLEEDLALIATKTSFQIPKNVASLKAKYDALFYETRKGELEAMFKYALLNIFTYVISIGWVVFMLLRSTMAMGILEKLRDPSRGTKRAGFDVIRIISLGIYSLDSKLSVVKLVLGSTILVLAVGYILALV